MALKNTFAALLGKAENFLRVFFDGLNRLCLTPSEFRVRKNCLVIRQYTRNAIAKRKQGKVDLMAQESDILGLLLEDDYFK
jgi:hypothetical protein